MVAATPAAAEPSPGDGMSAKAVLIAFFSQQWEGRDQAALPDLVDEAVAAFRNDRAFLLALAQQSIREIFYDLLSSQLAHQRAAARSSARRIQAAQPVGRTTSAMPTWAQWRERVLEGFFKRLPAMTRPDLASAIAHHRRILDDHEHTVRFLTALRDGMPADNDTVTVDEHYGGDGGITAVYLSVQR